METKAEIHHLQESQVWVAAMAEAMELTVIVEAQEAATAVAQTLQHTKHMEAEPQVHQDKETTAATVHPTQVAEVAALANKVEIRLMREMDKLTLIGVNYE